MIGILREFVQSEILRERRSGRKILRTLQSKIARDIMSVFKGHNNKVSVGVTPLDIKDYGFLGYPKDYFLGAYELGWYSWEKNIDTTMLSQEELEFIPDPEIVVTIAIVQDPSRDVFNVAGGSIPVTGDPGIDIVIEIPIEFSTQNFGALYEEINITILHELEHMTQKGDFVSYERNGDYYSKPPNEGLGQYATEYLLNPEEIAAHVIGYSTASSSMADLEKRFNRDLGNYVAQDTISAQDKTAVLNAWLKWAKKHLKQKRFQ
jgi:hypothetical protein